MLALLYAIKKVRLLSSPNKFLLRVTDTNLEKMINEINYPSRIETLMPKIPVRFEKFQLEVCKEYKSDSKSDTRIYISEETFYIDGDCAFNGEPHCVLCWAISRE